MCQPDDFPPYDEPATVSDPETATAVAVAPELLAQWADEPDTHPWSGFELDQA